MDNDLLESFVGDKYQTYYQQKWQQDKSINFNLAAFFLGIFWMCYRKMYLTAFLMLAAVTVFDLVMMHMLGAEYEQTSAIVYNFAVAAISGLLGNYFYKQFSLKKSNQIAANTSNPQYISGVLASKGGTTWIGAIFMPLLLLVLVACFYALFAPDWYTI